MSIVRRRTTALLATTVAVIALTACGSDGSDAGSGSGGSGTVALVDAWARTSAPTQEEGAAYVDVVNGTDETLTLTGASVPDDIAKEAQIHETLTDSASTSTTGAMGDGSTSGTSGGMDGMGDMTRMREVATVTVAAGDTMKFEPGGHHIMLMELRQPLERGQTFELTLHRRGGPDLTTTVTVRDA
jgi:copper(I)-binding protein